MGDRETAGALASASSLGIAPAEPWATARHRRDIEAARRLGTEPRRCAAVEDSANGLRAASAAGMLVIAIPNRRYPPDPEALALADLTLPDLTALSPEVIRDLGAGTAA